MSIIEVNLGKGVRGEELEKLLLNAAKDIGMGAKSTDSYNEIVRLNPVRKEQTKYNHTNIRLEGVGYADISIDKYSQHTETIVVCQHCLDEEMNKYLDALSKQLNNI